MAREFVFHEAGEGRELDCGALNATLKVESDRAAGCSVLEITLTPGFDAGFHVHQTLEETFYVLDGEVTFTAGPDEERVITAGPGATLFMPPTVPHRVANRGTSVARCLLIWAPATQDGSLAELAALLSQPGELSLEAVGEISTRYDTRHISDDAVRVTSED